ncbi:10406_t:CDS:2 [Entrophospora sp. SA101]|nr:10406_t:CDS:2 [Entrophospora sp. SA101]
MKDLIYYLIVALLAINLICQLINLYFSWKEINKNTPKQNNCQCKENNGLQQEFIRVVKLHENLLIQYEKANKVDNLPNAQTLLSNACMYVKNLLEDIKKLKAEKTQLYFDKLLLQAQLDTFKKVDYANLAGKLKKFKQIAVNKIIKEAVLNKKTINLTYELSKAENSIIGLNEDNQRLINTKTGLENKVNSLGEELNQEKINKEEFAKKLLELNEYLERPTSLAEKLTIPAKEKIKALQTEKQQLAKDEASLKVNLEVQVKLLERELAQAKLTDEEKEIIELIQKIRGSDKQIIAEELLKKLKTKKLENLPHLKNLPLVFVEAYEAINRMVEGIKETDKDMADLQTEIQADKDKINELERKTRELENKDRDTMILLQTANSQRDGIAAERDLLQTKVNELKDKVNQLELELKLLGNELAALQQQKNEAEKDTKKSQKDFEDRIKELEDTQLTPNELNIKQTLEEMFEITANEGIVRYNISEVERILAKLNAYNLNETPNLGKLPYNIANSNAASNYNGYNPYMVIIDDLYSINDFPEDIGDNQMVGCMDLTMFEERTSFYINRFKAYGKYGKASSAIVYKKNQNHLITHSLPNYRSIFVPNVSAELGRHTAFPKSERPLNPGEELLTIRLEELIDKAENVAELALVIRTIELGFSNTPPKDDRGIIPFLALREVKEITQTEQPLNYTPDESKGEEFAGYKYKTETKPAGYVLQKNEQLASINEDKTLKVNVPEKQIINVITYEDALEVKDLSSYTQYLFKQQLLKHEFDPEPYVLPNNNVIETYQQFQHAPYLNYVKNSDGTVYYPMCPEINLYLSDVEAIINDLETLLRDVYYRVINNPALFKTNLKTSIQGNLTDIEQGGKSSGIDKERSFQRIHETESQEQPLKTAVAETNREWGEYKANIFKNQSKETTQENVKFDKEVEKEESKKNKQRGEQRTISRDVVLDSKVLEFLGKTVDKFLIYKDIGKILDKHFYSMFEPLPTWEELEEM